MKLAIMQPYIFPYIGYYQLMCECDTVVFLDDVNFIKKGFINRNNLLCNDELLRFTIPIKKMSQNVKIKDTYIHNFKENREKFLKQIKHCYSKAPYFSEVWYLLNDIFNETLVNKPISYVAAETIHGVFKYLNRNLNYTFSSLLPTTELKKEQRIISICKHFNASVYINPIGGVDLYSKNEFKTQNIDLFFLTPFIFKYPQKNLNTEFKSHLSIIDVLMYNNKESVNLHLNKNTLI